MKPLRIVRRAPRATAAVPPEPCAPAEQHAPRRGLSSLRQRVSRSPIPAPGSVHRKASRLSRHLTHRSAGFIETLSVPDTDLPFAVPSATTQDTSSVPPLPEGIPSGWQRVDDGTVPSPDELQRFGPVVLHRRNLDLWTLVCSALRIPWKLGGSGLERGLYVPETYAQTTRQHLAEVAAEGRFAQTPARPPARRNIH